jgi:hypothetical protein
LLVLADEGGGGVGGVIVDDDDFPGEGFDALLGLEPGEDRGEAGGAVASADDDGYFHSLSFRRRTVQGLRGGRSLMTLMPDSGKRRRRGGREEASWTGCHRR